MTAGGKFKTLDEGCVWDFLLELVRFHVFLPLDMSVISAGSG
jgi:hypothetical protein